MSTKRIAQLKQMLAGRTDRDGNALKGYTKNVVAIRAELTRLEAVMAAAERELETAPAAPATTGTDSDAALIAANG